MDMGVDIVIHCRPAMLLVQYALVSVVLKHPQTTAIPFFASKHDATSRRLSQSSLKPSLIAFCPGG